MKTFWSEEIDSPNYAIINRVNKESWGAWARKSFSLPEQSNAFLRRETILDNPLQGLRRRKKGFTKWTLEELNEKLLLHIENRMYIALITLGSLYLLAHIVVAWMKI